MNESKLTCLIVVLGVVKLADGRRQGGVLEEDIAMVVISVLTTIDARIARVMMGVMGQHVVTRRRARVDEITARREGVRYVWQALVVVRRHSVLQITRLFLQSQTVFLTNL